MKGMSKPGATMPHTQNPIVEWPAEFHPLLAGFEVATGGAGKRFGRVDIDIDPATLCLLNEFEAHVRHRQVRLRPSDSAGCLVGEMNVLIGLGAAAPSLTLFTLAFGVGGGIGVGLTGMVAQAALLADAYVERRGVAMGIAFSGGMAAYGLAPPCQWAITRFGWRAALAGYAVGSVPTAVWLGRLWGVDLLGDGSGNPGANNARRLGGHTLAVLVLIIEITKGLVAVLVGLAIGGQAAGLAVRTAALETLAEDEVRVVAGVRRRRLHRSAGLTRRAGRAARRLLRR